MSTDKVKTFSLEKAREIDAQLKHKFRGEWEAIFAQALKEAREQALEEACSVAHNYMGAGFGPNIEQQIRALKARERER